MQPTCYIVLIILFKKSISNSETLLMKHCTQIQSVSIECLMSKPFIQALDMYVYIVKLIHAVIHIICNISF